ncbi:MAG: hypothetical protein ACKVG0_10850 [Alphaproteobacteria bacterium]
MRVSALIAGIITGLFAASFSHAAYAQAWASFYSEEDRFALGFPGDPTITEMEWLDENAEPRSARRYSAERAGNVYTLVAVNYDDIEEDIYHPAYEHATAVYREMGEVTFDDHAQTDRIDGHQLQITLPDGRRLYLAAHYHGGRLYILDANVSARSAPPGQFQQNLQIVDNEGVRVRYTQEGERMIRTDDLQDALGGPILSGPIFEGNADTPIAQ